MLTTLTSARSERQIVSHSRDEPAGQVSPGWQPQAIGRLSRAPVGFGQVSGAKCAERGWRTANSMLMLSMTSAASMNSDTVPTQ